MRQRSLQGWSLLVLALTFAGCGEDTAPGPPTAAAPASGEAPAPAAPDPAPEFAPLSTAQRPTAAPASAPPVAPASNPTRSGARPGSGPIKQALAALGIKAAALQGHPQPLGDGRFVGVVFDGAGFHAFTVSDDAGQARIEGHVELDCDEPFLEYEAPRVAARDTGDLDADGEPEAWVFIKYDTKPEPGVGGHRIGKYFVVDVEPATRVAFATISQDAPEASVLESKQGKVRYADVNDDGHPDVVVSGRTCVTEQVGDEFEEGCRAFTERYLWDAASDSWQAAP